MPIADEFELVLAAGQGTKANPVRGTKKIYPPGTRVLDIIAAIPAGHDGEVPWWTEFNEARRFPTGQGEIRLNDVPAKVVYQGEIVLEETTVVEIVGYNEDTVNAHTVRMSVRGKFKGER